jgi:hypothetical protein
MLKDGRFAAKTIYSELLPISFTFLRKTHFIYNFSPSLVLQLGILVLKVQLKAIKEQIQLVLNSVLLNNAK